MVHTKRSLTGYTMATTWGVVCCVGLEGAQVMLWLHPGVLSAVLAWRELRLCYGYTLGCCLLCWLGGSSGYTMATNWGVVCCVGLEGAQVTLWLQPEP